jgi:TonB family protein
VILIVSVALHDRQLHRQDFLPINLVDLPRPKNPAPPKTVETPPEINKLPPYPVKVEKSKETTSQAKTATVKSEQPAPSPRPTKEEVAQTKSIPSAKSEAAPIASGSRVEGGGSEAGAGNLFGKGEVSIVPGTGTAGGGGGAAPSGLGRGSGSPGLPAQTTPLKTDREAKPIQTARATYPPMALRAGLESDVTLRIVVDAEGKVTKAEIIKSGGAGFDEEAVKAVNQSRFEPAQRDGQHVPADFTYVYRFRLQR